MQQAYHAQPSYPPAGQLHRQPTYGSYTDSYYAGDDDMSYSGHSVHSTTQLHQPSYFSPSPGAPPVPNVPSPYQQPTPYYGDKMMTPAAGGGGFYSPSMSSPYAHVRQQILEQRERKQIELQDGHLVLDCPVPQSILTYAKDYSGSGGEEFKKMRYTAVTHDPDAFNREGYRLRQKIYGRQTELAIVATMYNEDDKLFDDTMTSISKNIQHFQSRTSSKTWGAGSWEKIVVCIVADGRSKIHPRVLKFLGLMGVYQEGIAKDTVLGKEVTAHIFEYSTQVVVNHKGDVSGGIAPIQVIFVLKEANKKKLNSHRWFFNAVCAQLNPNVCVLIDVGTRPSGTSLYHLWKEFDKHKNVGGACGEITVDTGRGCSNLINPLVAAQNFEYKMSNILDKPLESVFGFISVLPGAFSAYRWKALQGRPLQAYFLGEKMHEPGYVGSAFDSNMYLAEDRILCFEIVVKKNASWILKYCKSAKASTDVPPTVAEFIGQRRRWLNGSFFAAVHATICFWKIWTSGHNIIRCFWLQLEFIYNLVQMLFTWTAPANFFLSFYFILNAALGADSDNKPFGKYSDEILELCTSAWLCLLFVILVCSLGNRPQGSRFAYTTVMLLFAIFFCVSLYCTGFLVYHNLPHTSDGWQASKLLNNPTFVDIIISIGATYGLYIITSFLHFEPWHLFTCMIQYMLLLPSTVNILAIYSFANIHDVSWGTKGQDGSKKDLGSAKKGEKDGRDVVEVDIPTAPKDIDRLWQGMRSDLARKEPEKKDKRSPEQKQTDHMANYRTNVLLAFLGTNTILVFFFTSSFFLKWMQDRLKTAQNINPYLVAIFWSVAVLSAIRAFGSISYLLLRLVGH